MLGPDFAEETLGLSAKDLAVVVLPMGFGIVMGILLLNAYGKYVPRRRVIEGGLIALGLGLLEVAVGVGVLGFVTQSVLRGVVVEISPRGLTRGFLMNGRFLGRTTVTRAKVGVRGQKLVNRQ